MLITPEDEEYLRHLDETGRACHFKTAAEFSAWYIAVEKANDETGVGVSAHRGGADGFIGAECSVVTLRW